MLDLAMNPDEAFKAPLKTTKLAPVTAEIKSQSEKGLSKIKREGKLVNTFYIYKH